MKVDDHLTRKNDECYEEYENNVKTITTVDPGFKNMSIYKYHIESDSGMAWAWIDLCGIKLSKLSAKELKNRLLKVFREIPVLFDSDLILVEKQNKMSRSCHKIEKTFKKFFGSRCRIVCPKKTKKGVISKLKKANDERELKKKSWENKRGPKKEYSEV